MELDCVYINVCPVLFYVSAFMVISNVDFPFPSHSLLVITWIICLATSSSTWSKVESYVSAPQLVRILWTTAMWQFWHHHYGGPYMLCWTFYIIVLNIENVLGFTSGRYDKQLMCFHNAFFFQRSLIAMWIEPRALKIMLADACSEHCILRRTIVASAYKLMHYPRID